MFHNSWFLQSDMVLGIMHSFPRIFDAISGEKNFPTSMLFLLTYVRFRTVELFPPAEF